MTADEFTITKLSFKGESVRSVKGKPEKPPNAKKNFQNLVDHEEENPSSDEEPFVRLEEPRTPPSLFELMAKTKTKGRFPAQFADPTPDCSLLKPEFAITPSEGESFEQPHPFFEEFFSVAPQEILPQDKIFETIKMNETIEPSLPKINPIGHSHKNTLSSTKDKAKLNSSKKNDFFPKNPEIITTNYDPQNRQLQPVGIGISSDFNQISDQPKITRTAVNEIVEQMVKELQTIEKKGMTDTIVTLRYPPLFEDATITLTAFEGVKREFNVSFANLKDEAKIFLDRKIIEDSLVETLARNDIMVRLLTTTTLAENSSLNAEPQNFYAREEREQKRERYLFENQDEEI
ncbi:MAG: hypothetical protein H0V82_04305 [Candidatus Protochlamydia sp.]|nr:hypothetical protein [Candidatus Protochlamydia sp.]